MSKQIDPNLNSDKDELLINLALGEEIEENPFSFDPSSKVEKKVDNPDFKVSIKDDTKSHSNSEHHHSSSGEHHHHHSSGEHHHSSGEHHHHHSSNSSHHHSSHHRKHSSSHGKKKKSKLPLPIRILIIILVVLFAFVAIFAGTYGFLRVTGEKDIKPNMSQVSENYQDTLKYKGHTYKYNEDLFTVAFLGIDQEEFKSVDEAEFVGAADADIVITVNTKTGKTTAIAIPRDTMVDVEVWSESGIFLRTEKTQLCLAYAYADGGEQSCKNTMNAISRVLYNVPIQKYFALDLSGVSALNDAIGGVTVQSLYDFPQYGIKAGDTVTLKGETAKQYVRTRDMDKVDASLNRVDRQIQYIKAYASQLLPAVMRDFSTVTRLYDTASKYSQTNLTVNNATYIASLLLSKGVSDFETKTLTGTMEAEPDEKIANLAHAQFYPDEDELMKTIINTFYVQVD